ncbi:MAG: hypothetical protein JTT11_08020 [Candidatus Brockarchaeota archaeon]|nr:hypothetical protein [Candidatus Brockarchaeota archaeon]
MILDAGYVFDKVAKERANRGGRNYWWAYMAEVLSCMGLTAKPIPPDGLAGRLDGISVLFLDGMDASHLLLELEAWVENGGTLVGCNTEGLDRIFGNALATLMEQPGDEFSVSGYFHLKEGRFTAGVHSPLHPEAPLIAVSRLRLVKPISSAEIGTDGENAYITARSCGGGWAFYFGFDVAQTFWAIQQGRPVDGDYDGDGYWRTSDASVIGNNEPEVAYTDELLFLLQNFVGVQPFPMIHQLPPKGGRVPDFVLYYAGDDEGEGGIQVPASAFMASRGLPYHINAMPKGGRFAITPDEEDLLRKRGTELSLHFDFMEGFAHPGGFSEEDVKRQADLYVRRFGSAPVCANTHWWRWCGWAEPAIWMAEAGIMADNSFAHRRSPPLDPRNTVGFSFGTSFPHFFWSNFRRGNERIDFLELPVTSYEVGYSFSWEGLDEGTVDVPQLRKALLLAKHYGATMCMFYHPVYLARVPSCRRCVDELLSIARSEGLEVLHLGADEVVAWWTSRSRARIEGARFEGGVLKFKSSCSYEDGLIAKIPIGDREPLGLGARGKVVEKFGNRWLLLPIPPGENEISVHLGQGD